MEFPALYLADMPPEAVLDPRIVREASIAVKRNRARYLETMSTSSLVSLIASLGEECRHPTNPFRQRMLTQGPAHTGLSPASLASGLDRFFESLTRDSILDLLRQDLGHERRLDEICSTPVEQRANKSSVATGPEMIGHITPRLLPVSALQSMVLGLLAKSSQFFRCSPGTSLIPRVFAHALHALDSRVGSCLEFAEWSSEQQELTDALIAESGCVTAAGQDETLIRIRSRVPAGVRFIGFGNRLSFAFISKDLLVPHNLGRLAGKAAADVATWDQLGCLSPQVIYVEEGGAANPESFAEKLAQELDRVESEEPRAVLAPEVSATITRLRGLYEIRASAGTGTQLWKSENSTAWTVIFEQDPQFQKSCLHRFIYVKGVRSVDDMLQAADVVRGQVSTVGLAVHDGDAPEIVYRLARWGVSRVCPLGRMQQPPAAWRHDGRLGLAELVQWTDWEH